MGRRTVTPVDATTRPSHMGLVIVRIEVNTIPTRAEEYLSPHTVGTVMIEEAVTLSPVGVSGMIIVVIETNICDSGRVWIPINVVSSKRIARDHTEAIREGLDSSFAWRIAGQVICVHV